MYLRLSDNLKWQSSDVDWCERNYEESKYIVEYYNTISNIPFIVLPAILMVLSREYCARVSRDMYMVCALLMVIGVSSVYFHATLSMLGQLLDELAILWLDLGATALWLPMEYFPTFCGRSRTTVKKTLLITSLFCTVLGCLIPAANMFALMILSLILSKAIHDKITKSCSGIEYRMGLRSLVLWLAGMTVWAIDKFGCNSYMSVHFPFLHSMWHIAAVLATIPVLVLFALIETRTTHPHEKVQLAFWPSWSGELGMPYITFPNTNNNKSS